MAGSSRLAGSRSLRFRENIIIMSESVCEKRKSDLNADYEWSKGIARAGTRGGGGGRSARLKVQEVARKTVRDGGGDGDK